MNPKNPKTAFGKLTPRDELTIRRWWAHRPSAGDFIFSDGETISGMWGDAATPLAAWSGWGTFRMVPTLNPKKRRVQQEIRSLMPGAEEDFDVGAFSPPPTGKTEVFRTAAKSPKVALEDAILAVLKKNEPKVYDLLVKLAEIHVSEDVGCSDLYEDGEEVNRDVDMSDELSGGDWVTSLSTAIPEFKKLVSAYVEAMRDEMSPIEAREELLDGPIAKFFNSDLRDKVDGDDLEEVYDELREDCEDLEEMNRNPHGYFGVRRRASEPLPGRVAARYAASVEAAKSKFDAFAKKLAAKAKKRDGLVSKMGSDLRGLLPKVENANSRAEKKFDDIYFKLVKAASELVSDTDSDLKEFNRIYDGLKSFLSEDSKQELDDWAQMAYHYQGSLKTRVAGMAALEKSRAATKEEGSSQAVADFSVLCSWLERLSLDYTNLVSD